MQTSYTERRVQCACRELSTNTGGLSIEWRRPRRDMHSSSVVGETNIIVLYREGQRSNIYSHSRRFSGISKAILIRTRNCLGY